MKTILHCLVAPLVNEKSDVNSAFVLLFIRYFFTLGIFSLVFHINIFANLYLCTWLKNYFCLCFDGLFQTENSSPLAQEFFPIITLLILFVLHSLSSLFLECLPDECWHPGILFHVFKIVLLYFQSNRFLSFSSSPSLSSFLVFFSLSLSVSFFLCFITRFII